MGCLGRKEGVEERRSRGLRGRGNEYKISVKSSSQETGQYIAEMGDIIESHHNPGGRHITNLREHVAL